MLASKKIYVPSNWLCSECLEWMDLQLGTSFLLVYLYFYFEIFKKLVDYVNDNEANFCCKQESFRRDSVV